MPHAVLIGGLVAVAKVRGDGATEQECLLGYEPDELPQVFLADVSDVDSVDQHAADLPRPLDGYGYVIMPLARDR